MYLALGIGPGSGNHTHCEQKHRHHLNARVSLPIEASSKHSCDTTAGAQNDVHRDRDVVAEGMVVQRVDAEEEDNVDQPASDRDLVRLEVEGRARSVELLRKADNRDEEELDERKE